MAKSKFEQKEIESEKYRLQIEKHNAQVVEMEKNPKVYTVEELLKYMEQAFEFGKESIEYTDEEGYNATNNFADCLNQEQDKFLLTTYLVKKILK